MPARPAGTGFVDRLGARDVSRADDVRPDGRPTPPDDERCPRRGTPRALVEAIMERPAAARLRALFGRPAPAPDAAPADLGLLAMAPTMMHATDARGDIIAVSQLWLQHLGYARDEVIGRRLTDFLTAGSAHYATTEVLPLFAENGHCENIELQFVRRNGDVIDILLSATSERNTENRKRRSLAVLTDVTRLKRVERARRDSDRQLRLIANALPVAISFVDAEGRFQFVNRTFVEWHACERRQVIGRHFRDVTTPAMRGVLRPHLRAVRDGESRVFEASLTYPDGVARTVETTCLPVLPDDGGQHGFVVASSDLTERKSTEAKLQQAIKMEAVGQLTAGLAHDFNNLLAVILGNLQLLEHGLDTDPKTRKRAGAALDATVRGADLTKRLLAFSRQQSLEPAVVDINPLLQDLGGLLRHTLGPVIELSFACADTVWPVKVDGSQLETVVLNLAINARDAMTGGGALTIATGNVHLTAENEPQPEDIEPGDHVMIAVSDTGHGIPADLLAKVLQPFFTTKDVGKGSGLGLSMAYGFIKQSGGQMRIDSAEGRGTTIALYLPRHRHEPDRDEDGAPRPRSVAEAVIIGGGETILVVEDDAAVRQVTTSVLTELGYRVIEAETGADALAMLARPGNVDLLFSDIIMPGGVNGVELATLAAANDPDLRVLLTSGSVTDAATGDDRLAGPADLLGKPYHNHELARKIRQTLDRPARRRE